MIADLAPALAYAILHSLWQDTLLAPAAALTLRAMARSSAAWRHAVGMAFLAAMLLAPVWQFAIFWLSDAPVGDSLSNLLRFGVLGNALLGDAAPVAAFVAAIWLLGAGAMLARYVSGLHAIGAMERAPHQSLPPHWQQRADELRIALGIARNVVVRLTDDVVGPCATRLLRPIIWLPASLLTHTPAAQLEALLAHELAHIARKDWLWNGVQCFIEALLFYHPAMWWLSRRIRQEREHACDDLAVAACGDAVVLAEALAALAQERRQAPRLGLAAGGGSLLRRVTRLLAPSPPIRRRVLTALGALTIAGVLVFAQVGVGGGRTPDLHVSSSTAGALGPGDFRQIIADDHGTRRFYRVSVDAQGRLTEVYREDGRTRPIDAAVRAWIARVTSGQPPLT